MNYPGERIILAGTILICPICRAKQAKVICNIDANQTFDWRAIQPFDKDACTGISNCCGERYVTFSGLFYTEAMPV